MARFGQALKPSKAPQQLSKASAPHNPPLALPSYLPIGPSNCFYWASKLLQASALHNPPLALPSYLPIGPSNCFYWASKLLHGTFWPGLKTFKSPAAAFVPPHRRYKLFLLGFETATWHVLARPWHHLPSHNPPLALPSSEVQTVSIGLRNCYMARFGQALKPSKAPQQLSKASAPHNPPLALPSYLPIGPSNCFYWASKLLHGTFWPGLLLGSLSTAQPSACFAIVPPHRPYKLFLLGFETATWHVLARP